MTLHSFLLIFAVGTLVGLINGLVAKSRRRNFGLIIHVLVGIIGAFHGRPLFGLVGVVATSLTANLIFAAIGALLFLYPLRFLKSA